MTQDDPCSWDRARPAAEAYLIRKAGQTAIEAAALTDEQLAEHILALNGYIVVSAEIAREMQRIEAANYNVPLSELEAVIYAVYSGAYGEYHRPMEFA